MNESENGAGDVTLRTMLLDCRLYRWTYDRFKEECFALFPEDAAVWDGSGELHAMWELAITPQ